MNLIRALSHADLVTLEELKQYFMDQISEINVLIEAKEREKIFNKNQKKLDRKIRLAAEKVANHLADGHNVAKSITLTQKETGYDIGLIEAGWRVHRDQLNRSRFARRNWKIRLDHKKGLTQQELADKYGFKHKESVGRILRNAKRSL